MSTINSQPHEESILGDTQQTNLTPQNKNPIGISENNFMETMSSLLDSKLNTKFEQLRLSIIKDLAKEFNNKIKTLKHDFIQTTDFLTSQQNELKKQLNDSTSKICDMELQIKNLQTKSDMRPNKTITESKTDPQIEKENLYLKNKIEKLNNKINEEKYCKKIILYGLNEYENETEQILMEQIKSIFYDILDIDLNGYMEKIKRLGRRNYKRPVEIELISKRMTEYILLNSNWFKNTGLYVSKYLTMEQQQERQTLLKCLKTARENRQHAVIRDNKLYINGQLHIDIRENTNINNENNAHAKFSQTITPDRMTIRQQQASTLNQNKKPFRA